jgi:hypothetical protein
VAVNFALDVPCHLLPFCINSLFRSVLPSRYYLQVKSDDERVKWHISAPSNCLHFKNVQENSLVPTEKEFLFPPYSAFKVLSNRRGVIEHPVERVPLACRIICLEALWNNQAKEAQNAPTAPRY